MKKITFLMTTAMLAGMLGVNAADKAAPAQPAPAAAQAAAPEAKPISPEEMKKRIGYALGYQTGMQMAQMGPFTMDDIDMTTFAEGLKGALAGEKPSVDEAAVQAAFMEFQKVMTKRMEEQGKVNAEASKKFIEEAAKKEGVVASKTGLLYKVLAKGGDKKYEAPKDGQDKGTRFLVSYKGTLPNGQVFDENKDVEFPLDVIPGFREALTTMPVGSKWELYIPAELAYGAQGAGGKIGPNQALIFDLELKDILPPVENKNAPGQAMSPEQLQSLLNQAAEQQARDAKK